MCSLISLLLKLSSGVTVASAYFLTSKLKLLVTEQYYNSHELFTPSLLQSAKSATERSVAPGKGGDSSAVGDH